MIPVGIVGFRGYSGAELLRILAKHPHVDPVLLEHRDDPGDRPQPLGRSTPKRLPCTAEAVGNAGLAAVFLATPPEASIELAPLMLAAGARVIDLSGAFRLGDAERYARWYNARHAQPELFTEAIYGLPEMCRERIRNARLIANPGCYPTAANLAIEPLVRAGVIDLAAGIVCDAKSGVSGAGRKPSLKTSFCEVAYNLSVYSVFNHRHVPEILMISGLAERDFTFTAQLLPINRGILETIYFRATALKGAGNLLDIYKDRYGAEPFVRLYSPGELPDIHAVAYTNFCDIGCAFDAATGRALVVSSIDNLGKGAAGQAVQNMNLALGFDESAGLL